MPGGEIIEDKWSARSDNPGSPKTELKRQIKPKIWVFIENPHFSVVDMYKKIHKFQDDLSFFTTKEFQFES